jgi:hypothetical protein
MEVRIMPSKPSVSIVQSEVEEPELFIHVRLDL